MDAETLKALTNLTFLGLACVGIVNVIGFFKPNLDSKIKFAISFVSVFALTFVPAAIGNMILDKAKLALETVFAISGFYKLTQNVGGK